MTKDYVNLYEFISLLEEYKMNGAAVIKEFIIQSAHEHPETKIEDITISWYDISRCSGLKEQFINDYEDYLDWAELSECQKLTEEQMRKHAVELDWYEISKHQELSERFIRECADLLSWNILIYKKNFSLNFKREYGPAFTIIGENIC